jgi:hypothetical protein
MYGCKVPTYAKSVISIICIQQVLSLEWFADALELGVVKLPKLQEQYQKLQNEVQHRQYRKQ